MKRARSLRRGGGAWRRAGRTRFFCDRSDLFHFENIVLSSLSVVSHLDESAHAEAGITLSPLRGQWQAADLLVGLQEKL